MSDDRTLFDPTDHPNTDRVASVISLDDVRISRGWRLPGKQCKHLSLVYSAQDRAVECKDCGKPVDGFDAFMVLCQRFDGMEKAAQAKLHKAEAALESTVVRRAAKELDLSWGRKMAPCCPHCRRGLLPEDFANGARSAYGRDFELARRANGAPDDR